MKETRKKVLIVYDSKFLRMIDRVHNNYSKLIPYDFFVLKDSEKELEKIKQGVTYDYIFIEIGKWCRCSFSFPKALREIAYEGKIVGFYDHWDTRDEGKDKIKGLAAGMDECVMRKSVIFDHDILYHYLMLYQALNPPSKESYENPWVYIK